MLERSSALSLHQKPLRPRFSALKIVGGRAGGGFSALGDQG